MRRGKLGTLLFQRDDVGQPLLPSRLHDLSTISQTALPRLLKYPLNRHTFKKVISKPKNGKEKRSSQVQQRGKRVWIPIFCLWKANNEGVIKPKPVPREETRTQPPWGGWDNSEPRVCPENDMPSTLSIASTSPLFSFGIRSTVRSSFTANLIYYKHHYFTNWQTGNKKWIRQRHRNPEGINSTWDWCLPTSFISKLSLISRLRYADGE